MKKQRKVILENWQNFLADVLKNEGKKISLSKLAGEHHISTNAANRIFHAKLVSDAGQHKYKCLYAKYEPIHARKLADACYRYQKKWNLTYNRERRKKSVAPPPCFFHEGSYKRAA